MAKIKRICCFFGHRHIYDSESRLYELLLNQIEELVLKSGVTEFCFGEYGEFDALAYKATSALKASYSQIKTIYVQAYYKPRDENTEYRRSRYDDIIFPAIEEKPPRFAITYRNRAVVEYSDFCVFYVKWNYGGAFDTMRYAKRKNKPITNLATLIATT